LAELAKRTFREEKLYSKQQIIELLCESHGVGPERGLRGFQVLVTSGLLVQEKHSKLFVLAPNAGNVLSLEDSVARLKHRNPLFALLVERMDLVISDNSSLVWRHGQLVNPKEKNLPPPDSQDCSETPFSQ